MAAKLCILVLFFVFTTTVSLASSPAAWSSTKTPSSAALIRSYCENAVYPRLCCKVFRKHTEIIHPTGTTELTQLTTVVTVNRLRGLSKRVSALTHNATRSKDAKALKGCMVALGEAAKEARRSAAKLAGLESTTAKPESESSVTKAQAYMSKALTKEDLCADELAEMDDGPAKSDASRRVRQVKQLTANSLSLIHGLATAE
ncbi:pectinesterase inhibitor 3-like [Phoenix dactylifera]|uniref:Pectinesterase inhibitor 3-like n=1 Tax=Phoenix dactylifera TaxID=42345 RepID=A0A8B7BNV6_PHODC|nr:pectinesterase inhibitor 3-like [Phoenix dactylifera]